MKLSFSLLTALLLSTGVHADIVVIAKADSPIESLSREDLGRIYLKRMKRLPWVNNIKLIPVSQSSIPTVESEFYFHVTQKEKNQLRAYWARLMFTGKDKPPKDGKDDEGVKHLVTENAGAIGFIQESTLTGEFKVLYRIKGI